MADEEVVMELKAILSEARKAIQEATVKIADADAIVAKLTTKEKNDAGLDK